MKFFWRHLLDFEPNESRLLLADNEPRLLQSVGEQLEGFASTASLACVLLMTVPDLVLAFFVAEKGRASVLEVLGGCLSTKIALQSLPRRVAISTRA